MISTLALAVALAAAPSAQEDADQFATLWQEVGWSGSDSEFPGWYLSALTKVRPLSSQLLARIDALARAAGEPIFLS
ncbi:MAG TPA: hypothetical protein VIE88_19650, partial [Vicinamibacteria bacterium]